MDRALPASPDTEKLILGSILLNPNFLPTVAGALTEEDFSVQKNRLIFRRILGIAERSEPVDRVTLVYELRRHNELEAVDGLSYIVSLDDGLPQVANIDAYIHIVREQAVLRRIIFAHQKALDLALTGTDSAKELIADSVEQLSSLLPPDTSTGPQDTRSVIENYEGGINAFLQPHLRPRGLMTGFSKLDEMTGGLKPDQLIVVCARTGHGKSAWLLNVCSHLAVRTNPPKLCVIFSLEMSKESLIHRLICAEARVDSMKFQLGYLDSEERSRVIAAARLVSEAPIVIDDTRATNNMEIYSKLKHIESERGKVGLIGVDHIQLMGVASKERFENRNLELASMTRRWKVIGKEFDAPIIVLSQLSRAAENTSDRRPQLRLIRESGGIEENADVVLGLYRPELYSPARDDLRGLAELIVLKQREGPVGTIKLVFLKHCVRFESRVSEMDLPKDEESAKPKKKQPKFDYKAAAGGE